MLCLNSCHKYLSFAFSREGFGYMYIYINKILQLKYYVYIRLFKMSARLWTLIKEGGCCSAFLCKCSSHDMPENLQYYNNANKNGKLNSL